MSYAPNGVVRYDYPSHPAAELFPLLPDDQLRELAADIFAHGLVRPITLHAGAVLDGRNRLIACELAGVVPTFEEWGGDGSPWEYVWSLNGARRQLPEGQKAAIRLLCLRASEEWQKARGRRRDEANAARSAALVGNQNAANERPLKRSPATLPETVPHEAPSHTREQLAALAGASPRTAQAVLTLEKRAPALLEKVAAGEVRLTEAMRQLKRETLSERVAALPDGKHRVIYADPPWRYGDDRSGLDGYDLSAAEGQYPTMSTADLGALEIRKLSADDAVLFCWATFPLIPDALDVVRAWGFTYKTAFVWDKGRPNFGNYHNASAELLLVCTRGSCTPDGEKTLEAQVQRVQRVFYCGCGEEFDTPVWHCTHCRHHWADGDERCKNCHVERGGARLAKTRHSGKPEHFRRLIDRMYPHGPRVELFRRGPAPAGWVVWGNEAGSAAE